MSELKAYKLKMLAGNSRKKLLAAHPNVSIAIVATEDGFILEATVDPTHEKFDHDTVSLMEAGVKIIHGVVDVTSPVPAVIEKKAKEPKEPKPPREKKPKVRWRDAWVFAPGKVDARLAEGKPPFKEGSKRDITRQLLTEGTTVETAMEALGWNKPTVLSSFTEIAYLLHSKVILTKREGLANWYTMAPVTLEEIEASRKAREEARVVKAEEKQTKADKKAEKAALAAAAIASQVAQAEQSAAE